MIFPAPDEDLEEEDEYEEDEDLEGSVWLPVIIDKKVDKTKKKEILSDPAVKEMDLA